MDEMVHVEAEGLDVVHVLVREMLTSLEMFRIGAPVMHEYQRDEPLDHALCGDTISLGFQDMTEHVDCNSIDYIVT